MEQLKHFSHKHLLYLVHMQWNKEIENSDEEEEDEEEDEDVEETRQSSYGECKMCREPIYSFQLCYYRCKECADDYSLHKFCAELPITIENHPSHPGHNLDILYYVGGIERRCDACRREQIMFCYYYCSICKFRMDIVCATISKQKMEHPSHPHQLQRMLKPMASSCHACGNEHKGTFYHCTTCFQFLIHVNCALLPKKLRIQDTTGGAFTHSHPLTLAYSFPDLEKKARFYPRCRVCGGYLDNYLWHYRCDKCWYYTHVDCATTRKDVWSTSVGKTSKNFEDKDHPNLLRLPFVDESENLVKHHFFNQKDHQLIIDETNKDGEILNHDSHQHPLILSNTNTSLAADNSISLHNPLKRNQLLCDGCVRPITTVPFYKCSSSSQLLQCGFVLHKWCAHLPSRLHDHPGHPNHTLSLMMPNVPNEFFGVFNCSICELPSNGFAYGCTTCEYYVDINCAFIPEEITHEAHPNHLLSRIDVASVKDYQGCNACKIPMRYREELGFSCRSCDFSVHTKCAFLLPSMITHKLDKHMTLNLRYGPVENHISEYFCEVCENGLNPTEWFYHCSICAQSIHAACAPLILENEQYTSRYYISCVFRYINVKFGGTLDIMDRLHPHRLTFVQGVESDGRGCVKCDQKLQYKMIFKCMECPFAIHHECIQRP